MADIKIQWKEMPPEVREVLEPLIMEWAPFAPRWCEDLTVRWETGNGTETLSTRVMWEYRTTTLIVCPPFLELPKEQRRSTVLHEFIHIAFEQSRDVFFSLVAATTEANSPLRDWAREEHRKAMECCITDIENGIYRLMDASKTSPYSPVMFLESVQGHSEEEKK